MKNYAGRLKSNCMVKIQRVKYYVTSDGIRSLCHLNSRQVIFKFCHSAIPGFVVYISVSYCMVCAYVREDNPRALASGLSPVHMHNHIAPACVFTLCIVRYLMQNIGISLKGAIIKDNAL